MNDLKSEEYYNFLADIYDRATCNAWNAPIEVSKSLLPICAKDKSILDIGIGTGQAINEVYNSTSYSFIEGIDVSEKMLNYCRIKYPKVNLHLGNFQKFKNFELDNFDIIICSGALEFIENIDSFFKKCKKLLAQKGILIFTYEPIIEGHSVQKESVSEVVSERSNGIRGFMTYRYEPKVLYDLLNRHGFKIIEDKLFVAYRKLNENIIYSLLKVQL